jgi:membrane protease YdiL (CAAX protease family)
MPGAALRTLVARHQVLSFAVLTYAISWAIWWSMARGSVNIGTTAGGVANIVATAGPSIAALIVAAVLGRRDLLRLVKGFSRSRVSSRWALVALVLPQVMIVIAIAINVVALGAATPVLTIAVVGNLAREFVRVLFLGGPLEEELGWRGFALPRLQARQTAFNSALALGLVWGLWHIPLYFVPGTGQFETVQGAASPAFAIGAFVVWTIGLSILLTWLFNETRGSLVVAILFHASVNLGSYVPQAVGSTGAASTLYAVITWIVALTVVARWGRRSLASVHRVTEARAPERGNATNE